MPRYIDVDTVAFDITGLARISPYNFRGIAFYFLEQLDSMPSADVRENIRGKWVEVQDETFAPTYYCSNCKEIPLVDIYGYVFSNFCPFCGADMRGYKK